MNAKRLLPCLLATTALFSANPAVAGEDIVYAPAPEWVEPADLPPSDIGEGMPIRLFDSQVRIADGVVWQYQDTAFKIDTPDSLTQLGTLTAQWLPDKGDLHIHAVDLVREGKRIDVLANGGKFELLRRETQLEQRIVDGSLTATFAVPDMRVGDTLRFSYSTTRKDQALGEEAEFSTLLLRQPVPVARGRIKAQWPADGGYRHQIRGASISDTVDRNGAVNTLEFDLPVGKADVMPTDAPSRFNAPAIFQISSFADWGAVSRVMAPHYATQGAIAADSQIASEVARIMAATPDALGRAALATQLVQDEIAYLMNGLNGGNYLPQSPALTWEKRYGDCKAKSFLLLAMLRELGITAEAVLVLSKGGDVIPEMLPVPGNFDHMIVRAEINGMSYWLDGTSSGTRLANIADTPRFYYALPVREAGADLMPIEARPKAVPDRLIQVTLDQRAGFEVPATFDAKVTLGGQTLSLLRNIDKMGDAKQTDQILQNVISGLLGEHSGFDRKLTFDDDAGTATISSKGVMTSKWSEDGGRWSMDVPYQPAAGFAFDNDRSKPDWRDVPVAVNGPLNWQSDITILLPEGGAGITMHGEAAFAREIGGNAVESEGGLDAGRFVLKQSVRSKAWEIPASELLTAKRDSLRMSRQLPRLEANAVTRRAWQYAGKDRKLLASLENAYAAAIDAASSDDEALAYYNRAAFRRGTSDWKGALADMNRVVLDDPSAVYLIDRGSIRWEMGDLQGALADYERAEELDPDGSTTGARVTLLGLLGQGDKALTAADEFALIAESVDDAEEQRAFAMGWADKRDEGLQIISELAAEAGGKSSAQNGLCWYAGIWNMASEETLQACRKAVEQSDDAANALDSRALVLHRLGRHSEALADLNSALSAHPGQHESRYLRGIIRLATGDAGGKEDMAQALQARPSLARMYRAYGLVD